MPVFDIYKIISIIFVTRHGTNCHMFSKHSKKSQLVYQTDLLDPWFLHLFWWLRSLELLEHKTKGNTFWLKLKMMTVKLKNPDPVWETPKSTELLPDHQTIQKGKGFSEQPVIRNVNCFWIPLCFQNISTAPLGPWWCQTASQNWGILWEPPRWKNKIAIMAKPQQW